MHFSSFEDAEELAELHGVEHACLIAKAMAYDMLVDDNDEEGFNHMQRVVDHLLRLSQ